MFTTSSSLDLYLYMTDVRHLGWDGWPNRQSSCVGHTVGTQSLGGFLRRAWSGSYWPPRRSRSTGGSQQPEDGPAARPI